MLEKMKFSSLALGISNSSEIQNFGNIKDSPTSVSLITNGVNSRFSQPIATYVEFFTGYILKVTLTFPQR